MRTFAENQPEQKSSANLSRSSALALAASHAPLAIQSKLAVNTTGNVFEQEADHLAEEVMRMPEPQTKRVGPGESGPVAAPPIVDKVLASPGQPLDASARAFFEPCFGHDFSRVRVHSGPAAEESAHALNAQAYSVGSNIVFGKGRFTPATQEGRRLLAHELTHVVQQSNTSSAAAGQPKVFRKPDEPHYPSKEEQAKIQELLGRTYKTTKVVTTASGEQVIQQGRVLTIQEIRDLAASLEQPYADKLNEMDRTSSSLGSGLDRTEAFEVVESARKAILDRFGKYTKQTATLTLDDKITDEARKKAGQVLVVLGDPNAAAAFARTIFETHCEPCQKALDDLEEGSRNTLTTFFLAKTRAKHLAQLRRVAEKMVPGKHGQEGTITLRLTERNLFFQTAVHELIHQFVHPSFRAAFIDQRQITEGFTDYFAHQVYGGDLNQGYAALVSKVQAVRDVLRGPFKLVVDESGEESLRQAYFGGHLEYIGWVPNSEKEKKAVAEAHAEAGEKDEPSQWDAATAGERAKTYRAQAVAHQAASRNVIQVGLFFSQEASDTIAVRYTRVIARTEPFAKWQLYLEGQVVGAPSLNPAVFGGSLGIGAEYQEPYFYAGGGARFIGTTMPGTGTNRLDVSPFVGLGVRPWQTIRVGAEGFALIPVTGQDKGLGLGLTLGVEL